MSHCGFGAGETQAVRQQDNKVYIQFNAFNLDV